MKNFWGADERIQQIQFRAASYGFFFAIALSFAFSAYKIFTLSAEPDWAELGEIFFSILVWFGGVVVFVLYSARKGVYRMMREEVNARPERKKKFLRMHLLGTIIYAAGMFSWKFFLDKSSFLGAFLFAVATALFYGLIMYFVEGRREKISERQ